MNFISFSKLAFITGNFLRGFFDGSVDEIKSTFTDAEIVRFKDTANLLQSCEPWENHLLDEAYPKLNKALDRKNYQVARNIISEHQTKTAAPW
jgi:hypothetical protein